MRALGMRGACVAGLAGTLLLLVVGSRALGDAEPADPESLSASDLGDLDEPSSILDALDPAERDAYDRSGMSGAREITPAPSETDGAEAPPEPKKSTLDKVGDATMSVLVVAVSVGAAVAPYLLF